ncbi:MAG: AbrB/MazE/SpoVT family DNA-binding domain-containing protein [Oscillospiraceae bacterium]|nr:AbrB/MazE/SpoVT family DNA-binding domain-containing protein [Oscillospiraceae bacterium]
MPRPEGKYMFGVARVGDKGQIVIPKKARDVFSIQPGDSLMVLGDEATGLALLPLERFKTLFFKAIEGEPGFFAKLMGEDEGDDKA